MKKIFITYYLLTITFCHTPVFAADFGAVTSAQLTAEKTDEAAVKGKVTIAPWFSLPFDMPVFGTADFYASLGLTASYDKKLFFIPELFRLELSARPMDALSLTVGRIPWHDASRLVAKGHFDGLEAVYNFGRFRLGGAALYTGLLYKETGNITVSPGDPKNYGADFTFSEFSDTYFAPRRFFTSLYGEIPGFLFDRGSFYAGLLAQFDLSDAGERFHTQYVLLRYDFVYKVFDVSASGAAGLEKTGAEGVRVSFAASVEGGMQLPTSFKDRLSLCLRYASGNGPTIASFFPIVREAQGIILKPSLSGIMTIRPLYEIRILPELSAQLGARYFIRTDSTSFADPYLNDDSYFIGTELDGSLLWVPYSDLSLSLGGGLFLPQTGRAMRSNAPVRWSITLGAIFSL